MLEAFGSSMAMPNDLLDLLSSFAVGHPFKQAKKILWEPLNNLTFTDYLIMFLKNYFVMLPTSPTLLFSWLLWMTLE